MAIPISYNIRSVGARWANAVVSVLGIAGTVGVFLAMLAMASGFQATLISSGSPDNVIILRAGADSEMTSAVSLEQVRIISDAPAGRPSRPTAHLFSVPEVVVIGAFPTDDHRHRCKCPDSRRQRSGPRGRPTVSVIEGRFFQPGLTELVVGKNAVTTYRGFGLG